MLTECNRPRGLPEEGGSRKLEMNEKAINLKRKLIIQYDLRQKDRHC